MDYAIGIVAHVSREDYVSELLDTIGGDDIYVNTDDGTLGAGGNHLAVLKTLRDKYPDAWSVVLEDDSVVAEGFRDQLQMALAVAPTKIVSLYLGTGYPQQYQKLFSDAVAAFPETCWLLHEQLRHAVGYAVHPRIVKPLFTRMETLVAQRYAPDDAIGYWAMRNREMIAYTNPSLVDHRDGPTIIDYRYHLGHVSAPGRKKPRTAHNFGTRTQWSDSSVMVTTRAMMEQTREPS